jgi:hypothetical protein
MAGDEDAWRTAVVHPSRRQTRFRCDQCVDARIAGYMNFARRLFGAEVCGCELRRREKQFGLGIDRGAIFLLRPWQARVMGP